MSRLDAPKRSNDRIAVRSKPRGLLIVAVIAGVFAVALWQIQSASSSASVQSEAPNNADANLPASRTHNTSPTREDRLAGSARADRVSVDVAHTSFVQGRVVDPSQRGVGGAEVELWWPGGTDIHRAGVADETGLYRLPIERSGTFDLAARASTVGAAVRLGLELKKTEDLALPDLVLHPAARIEGHVLHTSGQAHVGWNVSCARVDDDDSEDATDRARPTKPSLPEFVYDALSLRSTRTGPNGEFAFRDLEPGPYRIRVQNDEQRVTTDNLNVRFVIGSIVLNAHIRNHDRTATKAPLHWTEWSEASATEAAKRFAAGEYLGNLLADATKSGASLAKPAHRLIAKNNSFYLLSSEGRDRFPVYAGVYIGKNSPAVHEVDLILPQASQNGGLQVQLVDDAGHPIQDCHALLVERLTHRPITTWSESGLVKAPPGSYVLHARATPPGGNRNVRAPITKSVVVLAGIVRTVRLQVPSDGRLRLALYTSGSHVMPRGSRVTITSPAGANVSVGPYLLPRRGAQGTAVDWTRSPDPILGSRTLCGRSLTPGSYQVRIVAPGFAESRKRFRIRAGQITDVNLRLWPKR